MIVRVPGSCRRSDRVQEETTGFSAGYDSLPRTLRLVSCLAFIAAAAVQSPAEPTSIRVVMDNFYPPYIFIDDSGKAQGILVDQWRLWEERTGVKVELVATAWSEAQARMDSGEFDVIDTIFKTPERDKKYDFSKPYVRIEVPLFFDAQLSGIRGIEDLAPFVVAAKKGDAVVGQLLAHGIANLLLFDGYREIVEAARDGKVKVFTVDEPPALYYLLRMGLQDRFRRSEPLYFGEFHRAVPKGRSDTLSLVEKGFAKISPRELASIDRKWFGTPIVSRDQLKFLGILMAVVAAVVAVLILSIGLLGRLVARRTVALSASRDYIRAVYDSVNDAIFVHAGDGTILDCNARAQAMYGRSADEVKRIGIEGLSAADGMHTRADALARLRSSENGPLCYEWSAQHASGSVFPVEVSSRSDLIGGERRYFVTVRDISERKQAAAELEKAMAEKDALFRELQHRVKNSFALITGLINLEADSIADPATTEAIETLRGRIESISELYAMLFMQDAVEHVRLDEYLERVVESMNSSYGSGLAAILTAFDPVVIDVKRATSVGLILNELTTNALKYAFPERTSGVIRLSLTKEDAWATLVVADDGIGLPSAFDPARPTGLGLELVMMLSAQISGSVEFLRDAGTTVRIRFPV